MLAATRFLLFLLPWSVATLLLLSGPTLLSAGPTGFLAGLKSWLPMAVTLAAYPAGLAAANAVWQPGEVSKRLVAFALAGAIASLALFVLINFVAPAGGTSLAELKQLLQQTHQQATVGDATIDAWRPFNELAFQYTRRVDACLLPLILGGVGVCLGYWTSTPSRPHAARAAEWFLGAFLVVTTYFAGENGVELIIDQAAGPVTFVGDLVFIVPGALLAGLGVVVALELLRGQMPAS